MVATELSPKKQLFPRHNRMHDAFNTSARKMMQAEKLAAEEAIRTGLYGV